MSKPARRFCRRPISLELLESRLVLSASPLDVSNLVLPNNETLQSLGIVSDVENGQSAYIYKDQWVGSFSGWSGNRLQQFQTMQSLLGSINPSIEVVKSLGSAGQFLFQTPDSMDEAALTSTLSTISGFQYVEHNFLMLPNAVPNDPSFGSQWALNNTGQTGGVAGADIDALAAWNTTTGSSGVVVGVIDSGVDYTHPDLVQNMWVNPGETPGDGIDNDGNGYIDDIYGWDFANNDSNPMDDNGHGTAVSGIIAAAGNNGVGVTGINWGGKIMALKYAKSDFVSSTADLIEAVNYATMMRTVYGVNIRATNNSYGIYGNSQAFSDAIEANGDAGIMFVSSAGNSNSNNDTGPQYPANYPLENVLSVAATDDDDALASFSSYGPATVHLGAPGVNVLTTRLGGGYSGFSGTSAASPMVAGVVALLWDAAPYATVSEIKAALLNGTDPIPSLAGKVITGGRLNAAGAIRQLGFHVTQITPDQGSIVTAPPTEFTVSFSDDFDPSSIQAGDLWVNGLSADNVSFVGPRTATFTFNQSPVIVEGLQQIRLLEGSITRSADSDGVTGVISTFRYDATPLQVVSVLPKPGTTSSVLLDQLVVTFNESIDPSSVSTHSLVLSRGQVTGVTVFNANTVIFTVSGVTAEGQLTYSVPGKTIADSYGNPGTPYSGTIDLDVFQRLLTFTRLDPAGSLAFASLNNTGLINSSADFDDYTVTLAAGETLTAVVRATSGSPILTAEFVGVGSPVSSSSPGASVIVPLVSATGGTYRLRIGGNTRADYSFDVYRNAAVEWKDSTASVPQLLNGNPLPVAGGSRSVVVGTSQVANFYWNMDNSPGWTFAGSWAWGKPAGLGGDPSTGYSGSNVVGYNLNGAYSNSMLTTQYATLGPIDLTGKTGVTLSFRRWLGVQSSTFDRATIQVSNNGTSWTTIYTNPTTNLVETSWSLQSYDISSVADNKSTVYVRWGMGTTNSSTTFSGWNIDDVVIRGVQDPPASALDEDVYSVDLSGKVGHSIDFAVEGFSGVDFSNGQFFLKDSNGTIVATGTRQPNGAAAVTNSDLVIQSFKVTTPGIYSLVLRTDRTGQYTVVMTDNVQLESESNDTISTLLPRTLDPTNTALGFVGVPALQGAYTFNVNSSLSNILLTANVTSTDGTFSVPVAEQAPGSLTAQITGSIVAFVNGNTIRFQAANLDVLAKSGSFQPGSTSADFAGQISIGSLVAYAAIRNVQFTLGSNAITFDSNGAFDATQVLFEFTEGNISYTLLGNSDTFPVQTPDTGNPVSAPGSIQRLSNSAQITIPLKMTFLAAIPLGLNANFAFDATLVANVALPVPNDDYYAFNLGKNDIATIDVSKLPYALNLTDPTFLPKLTVYAPDGSVVTKLAGTLDSPNPTVTFTANQSGVYRVAVGAAAGQGEYTVTLHTTPAPQAVITGPTSLVRNQDGYFQLSQGLALLNSQTNPWKYEIDWNGDGAYDQVVFASANTVVTHHFATLGTSNVRLRVTGDQGNSSLDTTWAVNIVPYALQPDGGDSSKINFIVGGTDGDDSYSFDGQTLTILKENSQSVNVVVSMPSFNGKLVVFGGGGSDVISAQGFTGSADIFGGTGDDTIFASAGSDYIDGGEGADFIQGNLSPTFASDPAVAAWESQFHGGQNNDTIYGGLGSNSIDGGEGDDILLAGPPANVDLSTSGPANVDGGEGSDIVVGHAQPGPIGDSLNGGRGDDIVLSQGGAQLLHGGSNNDILIAGIIPPDDFLVAKLLAIQNEWISDRPYADRVANIQGTGSGTRTNGDTFLIPNDTVLDNGTIDQVFGDAGDDWFLVNDVNDLLSDLDASEEVTPLNV
ncbi:S8 family serine peptidase [bacterium]|nr:S8 family serine peptidase [bacterium]